nr:MAG TPA: hypothetical protein [Caudoviricetes sp.]
MKASNINGYRHFILLINYSMAVIQVFLCHCKFLGG